MPRVSGEERDDESGVLIWFESGKSSRLGRREVDVVVVLRVVGREGLGAAVKEGAPELEVLDCGGVKGSVRLWL